MKSLEELDLSQNQLTEIALNHFNGLSKSLKYLNLQRNKIETIEENSFAQMTILKMLDLSHNQIKLVKQNRQFWEYSVSPCTGLPYTSSQ